MAANGNGALEYMRLPSFFKIYSSARNMDELRLPPEFVGIHGGDLPIDCRLVMPNGTGWTVRVLQIACGCHFCTGWTEFRRDNRIVHGDRLTFTLVDVGTFHVKRYGMASGCPPRTDTELVEDEDAEVIYSPDVNTSDDYAPSEIETDTSDGRGVLDVDDYPMFEVKLTRSNINRTLEIPFAFWQQHIRMAALEDSVYFLVDGDTWEVKLEHSSTKIWVKRGWRRFKNGNQLVEGVRCHFKLVDAEDVSFYVWFERE